MTASVQRICVLGGAGSPAPSAGLPDAAERLGGVNLVVGAPDGGKSSLVLRLAQEHVLERPSDRVHVGGLISGNRAMVAGATHLWMRPEHGAGMIKTNRAMGANLSVLDLNALDHGIADEALSAARGGHGLILTRNALDPVAAIQALRQGLRIKPTDAILCDRFTAVLRTITVTASTITLAGDRAFTARTVRPDGALIALALEGRDAEARAHLKALGF